jgi:hypothetical protein
MCGWKYLELRKRKSQDRECYITRICEHGNSFEILVEGFEERDHLEDLSVVWRIILKCILEKLGMN